MSCSIDKVGFLSWMRGKKITYLFCSIFFTFILNRLRDTSKLYSKFISTIFYFITFTMVKNNTRIFSKINKASPIVGKYLSSIFRILYCFLYVIYCFFPCSGFHIFFFDSFHENVSSFLSSKLMINLLLITYESLIFSSICLDSMTIVVVIMKHFYKNNCSYFWISSGEYFFVSSRK